MSYHKIAFGPDVALGQPRCSLGGGSLLEACILGVTAVGQYGVSSPLHPERVRSVR